MKKQTQIKTIAKPAIAEKKAPKIALKFKSGAVSGTIFENEYTTKDGHKQIAYSFQIQRCYTKDEGKTFEYTTSMRKQDTPNMHIVLNEIFRALYLDEDEQKGNKDTNENDVIVDEEDIEE